MDTTTPTSPASTRVYDHPLLYTEHNVPIITSSAMPSPSLSSITTQHIAIPDIQLHDLTLYTTDLPESISNNAASPHIHIDHLDSRMPAGNDIHPNKMAAGMTTSHTTSHISHIWSRATSLVAYIELCLAACLGHFNADTYVGQALLILVSFALGLDAVAAAGVNVKAWGMLGVTGFSAIRAAFLSFLTGWLFISLWILINPRLRSYNLPLLWHRRKQIGWVQMLGGLFGSIYIAISVYLSGASSFGSAFVSIVAGQAATSLVVDTIGIVGFPRRRMNWQKLIGLLFIIGGVLMFQNWSEHVSAGISVLYIFAGLFCGSILVCQSPINGSLSRIVESTSVALWFSWLNGLMYLTVAASFTLLVEPLTLHDVQGLLFIGGPLGIIRSAGSIVVPPLLSMSEYYTANISGQLTMAIFFGFFGVFGKATSSWLQVGGLLLTVMGAALTSKYKGMIVRPTDQLEVTTSTQPNLQAATVTVK